MTLNHIHIGTKNLKKSQSFYEDFFGFKKKFDHGDGVFLENEAGFLLIKNHSDSYAEVYVMGVIPEFQSQGVGTALLKKAEEVLSESNIEFLQVKTVSEDREDIYYEKTRRFYKKYGFKEIEVFPTLWDKSNPCLLL